MGGTLRIADDLDSQGSWVVLAAVDFSVQIQQSEGLTKASPSDSANVHQDAEINHDEVIADVL